ncbi:MAG: sigma-54 dependent transcriptional regulator [Gemmataceae bacterium]|nr:sigma-54 dependent transcriptional regulator [Gemmataceae bacterium]
MPLEEATLQRLREASEVLARETLQRRAGDRQQAERNYRRDEDLADRDLRELAGESPSMRGVRQAIRQAAPTDATVLILGETGTGKELVARAIHQLSPRRNQLLVQVNCGALSPALVTSELFGHEQGAFTGAAKQRIGRLELADGGTLFLDEIGEMPPDAQVLLLRALQQRTLERVGGTKSIAIDVRIVAATHRDLESAVEAKAFRADLYYRLNVVPLRVPPLRERREDIPLLIRHFLQQTTRKLGRTFAPLTSETIRLLTQYEWPGNVRELQNVIERAAVLSPEERLLVDPAWFRSPASTLNPDGTWQERERAAIVEALSRAKGRIYGVGGAAAILGLRPTTLYGKMKKLGIPRDAE